MSLKKTLKELLAGAVLVFVLSQLFGWFYAPKPLSQKLPEVTLSLIDGKTYQLKKGKPVIIHFWATWCRVCRMEASNIDKISQTAEVLTVAVNSGSNEELKAYMREHDLHFAVYNDADGRWSEQFAVKAFPTTFIYDASGKLRFTEVGYTTTAGLLARLKLLGIVSN